MTYDATVLAETGLVAYWKMGEASGTSVADATGNGHTGAYVNTPTLGVAGLLTNDSGTAVALAAASSQYITVPTAAALRLVTTGKITLEIWLEYTYNGANQTFFWHGTGAGGYDYALGVDYNNLLSFTAWSQYGSGRYSTAAPFSLSTGVRHHVVVTVDSLTPSVVYYVDGVAVLTETTAWTGTQYASTAPFAIGRRDDNGWDYANGTVEKGALYNVALTSTRVAAHWAAGSTTPILLVGASAATASDSGALTGIAAALVGSAAAAGTDSAALTTAIKLAGASAAAASDAGVLTGVSAALSGVSAGVASDTAALTTVIRMVGASAATVTDSGGLTGIAAALTGASTPAATDSAALTTAIRLTGAAISAASDTAVLTGSAAALTGTAVATSADSASLTTAIRLVATSAAAATDAGALTGVSAALAATSAASASDSAGLTTAILMAGASAAVATDTGILTGIAAALVGASAGVASTSAAVTTAITMVGASAATSATSANITTDIEYIGSAVAVSSTSASLLTAILLVGASTSVSATDSTLTGGLAEALVGASAAQSATSADLTTAGAVPVVTVQTGPPIGAARIMGRMIGSPVPLDRLRAEAEGNRRAQIAHRNRLIEEDWLFGLIDDQEYARSAA